MTLTNSLPKILFPMPEIVNTLTNSQTKTISVNTRTSGNAEDFQKRMRWSSFFNRVTECQGVLHVRDFLAGDF